ncbi:Hint domain-containing protein [Pseudosulfitobacter koreensis]|uniref:Hint domain-containing protein n=1 Tax=Pseudosulfitobacter koreensis TaxID=2968472 RepID=A0ABT1YYJ5_9RHOB|nr:Hint domain-containing protein [Pseudosulfitobacter koreense]MCR8825961.1 Hint domain-containing protein [Pseudosulfitobacter koreense]
MTNPDTQSTPDTPTADEMKRTAVPDLERRMVSFTTGTRISTRKGLVAVEKLKVDDEVLTRDQGHQSIRWIASSDLTAAELGQNPQLQPIRVLKGALGPQQPTHDTVLNPNQRVLIASTDNAPEAMVCVNTLLDRDGIEQVGATDITYIHLVLDRHPVVMGDGLWSDSLQPGNTKAAAKRDTPENGFVDLFPELSPSAADAENMYAQAAAEKEYAQRLPNLPIR